MTKRDTPLSILARRKKTNFEYRLNAYECMLAAGVEHVGIGVLSGLSDWRRDWAMLMLHEEYLRKHYGEGVTIIRYSASQERSGGSSPGLAFYAYSPGVSGDGRFTQSLLPGNSSLCEHPGRLGRMC